MLTSLFCSFSLSASTNPTKQHLESGLGAGKFRSLDRPQQTGVQVYCIADGVFHKRGNSSFCVFCYFGFFSFFFCDCLFLSECPFAWLLDWNCGMRSEEALSRLYRFIECECDRIYLVFLMLGGDEVPVFASGSGCVMCICFRSQ